MNHPVNYSVLVDGEWVSRPVDVYQIMAGARRRQADTEMTETDAPPSHRVPSIGLLSRTIFASPLFKSVLPANIRHKDLNDVVLIGEDSVQLKEIRDYGHLRHVATKSDFKGRILAARVFGDPRQARVNEAVGSPLPRRQALHRSRRSLTGEPLERRELPPEVIVLTLSSRIVMFLWARQTPTGVTTFSQRMTRLPAWTSRFDRLGTFLAVDPKCRAIAVAAHEGRFILYKTKPMQQWRNDDRAGNDAIPIEDERIISFEGRVMHMEFLASGATGQDDYHVVLLFILVLGGKTKITCYDWDCRYDLSGATARAERIAVDFEDRNPSLLIPLSRRPDFLLVYDKHVSIYKDVLSGDPRHARVPIPPHILPSLRPGFSKHSDRWVQWDRAIRNPGFTKEAFYIAREDGRVMYAEQGPDIEIAEAGEWPYPIDTAFACLNVDNTEFSQLFPDVLISGGAGSDGQLCKVGAWPQEYSYAASYPGTNAFSHVDSIPNWAPLLDLAVTRLSGLQEPYERERCAIFVANGNAPNGEVSELRRGLHAIVDDSFDGLEGCTGLWVVDYGTQIVDTEGKEARQHYATFAITITPETVVIRVSRTQSEIRGNQGEFSGAWADGVWDKAQLPNEHEPDQDGLVREAETISACPWNDDFSIQISRNEATVLRRPTLSQHSRLSFQNPILLAVTKPALPWIVVAFLESGLHYIEAIPILEDGQFDIQRKITHKLECDPTCVELLVLNGTSHIFVGTFDSRIMLFEIHEAGRLVPAYEDLLDVNSLVGEGMFCESAVLLASEERRLLVCSTRNGFLLSLFLGTSRDRPSWQFVKMGTTSVRMHPSATDSSTAFVACGTDFCRIRCPSRGSQAIQVDSVWFSDSGNPGYAQCAVAAMYQLPLINTSHAGRNLGGFIFAVAEDRLLFSQLDYDIKWSDHVIPSLPHGDTKAVPRKLLTQSKPTKLAYIKTLRKMVIATTVAREERASSGAYRTLHASVKLLNVYDGKPLDEIDVKPEEGISPVNRPMTEEFPLKHYERVYSIVDWTYLDQKGSKYHFLILGTGITEGAGKETGRRLFLKVGKSGFKQQKESVYERPVYCMAMYDNHSMIAVVGKIMFFEEYEPAAGRWLRRGAETLDSPCIHITVSKPFIYVSTLQHSHICYEVVRHSMARESGIDFEKVFADSRERSCAHHLVLNLESPAPEAQPPAASSSSQHNGHRQNMATETIVIFSDKKSASVTGLYHPPEPNHRFATDTLFEAELPRTITRLQRGDIRPPWRRPCRHYSQPFKGITGVLADDLVGSCSDGTVYSFTVISEDARRLLRFLQILIELKENLAPENHITIVKPRSGDIFDVLMNNCDGSQDGRIRAIDVDPRHQERGQAAPKHKHVDGDLIERFMEENEDIGELVCEGTENDVAALFTELTTAVFPENGSQNISQNVATVTNWLEEVLMPVL